MRLTAKRLRQNTTQFQKKKKKNEPNTLLAPELYSHPPCYTSIMSLLTSVMDLNTT